MKKLFPLLLLCFTLNNSAPVWCHPIDMEILAQIESSNNPKAWNKKTNARGLYQITPIVLKQFKENVPNMPFAMYCPGGIRPGETCFDPNNPKFDLFDGIANYHVAEWYLYWLDQHCDTADEILIAWNLGIGNLRKWQKSHWKKLPKETKDFLEKYHKMEGSKK